MPRYDEENFTGNIRQKDLVLSTNEFVFIQSKTNGQIKTYTGPIMVTISAQESMVVFNPKTKRFEETTDFEKARQLFTSAPEGWYVVLKNPTLSNEHPEPTKAVNSPELMIGKKINVSGPCSFSLYPGQMSKVVRGHRLRSNQYLIARVYDAEAAEKNVATMVDAEGNEIKSSKTKYYAGQLMVIKGTEVSFYIPPTGIEVVPTDDDEYVRDAVTLERLEYAILKDEDGEKKYAHGPAVVFPEPTQTFVNSPKGGVIFRALELSPISGIYIKVIADYKDGDVEHKAGEELFITGKEQMIYYPRPEHALIQYDGKYMHHAIAIPKGEGRYVLNRLTGDIKTVIGPDMYLPDPRTEVCVKRKLSEKECNLYYPGNETALLYNRSLSEKTTEKLARSGMANVTTDAINSVYSTSNQEKSLAIFEANANISRGVSYTKPRTITLDTKYDGVVSIDVWSGYAISVVDKSGKRNTIVGPATKILDYDQTLEIVNNHAFLPIKSNRITDVIAITTKDYVEADLKVVYTIDFLEEHKDKWFAVENATGYIINEMRNVIKKEAKKHNIEELIDNIDEIVRGVAIDKKGTGKLFVENGSVIKECEVQDIDIEDDILNALDKRNVDAAKRSIELADAEKRLEDTKKLAEYADKQEEIKNQSKLYAYELFLKSQLAEANAKAEIQAAEIAIKEAETKAQADLQPLLDQIEAARISRIKMSDEAENEKAKKQLEIEKQQKEAYAATVEKIMGSISEDLVAAMNSKANNDLVSAISHAVSPYSIAKGESITDTVDKLLRGTTLEDVVAGVVGKK